MGYRIRTSLALCLSVIHLPLLLASLLLVMFALPPAFAAFALPADSPLFDDLDHFRSLGLWNGSLEFRPMRDRDFREAVRAIERSARARALSQGDAVCLTRLLRAAAQSEREIPADNADAAGTSGAAGAGFAERDGLPAAFWSLSGGIQLQGVATSLDSLADLDRRQRRDPFLFLGVRAALGSHVRIESRFYEDYSGLTNHPRRRWVDNLPPDFRGVFTDPSARNDRAVLSAGWDWIDLRIGREDRQWGCGRRGTLFLSSNAFPLDGVSLGIRTRYVSAASLFAQTLRTPNPPLAVPQDSPRLGDAYMAAHRIEVHPPGPARLGLYEAVAFGGRGIDLAYVNPVAFLVAVTQDLFDRSQADDKKILGADLQLVLPPVRVYGEFLLNRLVALDSAPEGQESEISSYAQLAGLRLADPLGWSGSDLHVEYAHLDPEVYFHRDRDPRRAFLTEGELIGHWAGPNADVVFAAWTAPPFPRFGTVRLEVEQIRWGNVEGLRGSEMGFIGMKKNEKRWITGSVERERIFSLHWNRPSWGLPVLGTLDAEFTGARVERSGAWSEATSQDGWQAEFRLLWRGEMSWNDRTE